MSPPMRLVWPEATGFAATALAQGHKPGNAKALVCRSTALRRPAEDRSPPPPFDDIEGLQIQQLAGERLHRRATQGERRTRRCILVARGSEGDREECAARSQEARHAPNGLRARGIR